jgi:serine phosphatase RsbU (regulator of sigma subunit)
MTLTQLWNSLSSIGLRHAQREDVSRSLVLSNQIVASIFLLVSMLFIATQTLIPSNEIVDTWLLSLLAVLVVNFILNGFGFNGFSRLLLSVGLPLIVLFSTIHSKMLRPELIHEASYYNPRFFLIGLVFIPLIVFQLSEKRFLFISLGINLIVIIAYNDIHEAFGVSPEALSLVTPHLGFASLASSLAALSLSCGMLFFKINNARFETQVKSLLRKSEFQKEEIISSIRYAERLQQSMLQSLPNKACNTSSLGIIYQPKDLVSGDFYFYLERDNKCLISVIDCTGHGVPGAFLSMIGHQGLKTAVDQWDWEDCGSLVQQLDQHVQYNFRRAGKEALNDGMDMSICLIDFEKQTIQSSGANGLIFLAEQNSVKHIKTLRKAIGGEESKNFSTHTFNFQKGDLLVLTSDGFYDQFGGERGKKMGRKRFTEMLAEGRQLRSENVSLFLQKQWSYWKKEEPQVDDVCLISVSL